VSPRNPRVLAGVAISVAVAGAICGIDVFAGSVIMNHAIPPSAASAIRAIPTMIGRTDVAFAGGLSNESSVVVPVFAVWSLLSFSGGMCEL